MSQQKNDYVKNSGSKAASYGTGAVLGPANCMGGGVVATGAAKLVAGSAPAAPIVASAAAASVANPASLLAVPGNMVGSYTGGAIGKQIGGDTGAAIGGEIGGATGAVGTGAAVGAMMAGPPGAAAGATVAGVGHLFGKAVEGTIYLTSGTEGNVKVWNKHSKPISVYSYDEGDMVQAVSYAALTLESDQWGTISATEGILASKCRAFYIHIYHGDSRRSPYAGFKVDVTEGIEYHWNGTTLKKVKS